MKDDQQQIDELEAALDGARHETRQWVDEHLKWRQRAEAAEAELAQVRQERDELAQRNATQALTIHMKREAWFAEKTRADSLEAARDHLRARLRELVEKLRADGEDAKDRGYLQSWNTYYVCANQLLAILSEPEEAQQTEKERARSCALGVPGRESPHIPYRSERTEMSEAPSTSNQVSNEVASLKAERSGLQRRVAELDRQAAERQTLIGRLELALASRTSLAVGACRTCDDVMRAVPYCSRCGPHSWYGPCDGLGDDGGCSECARSAALLGAK